MGGVSAGILVGGDLGVRLPCGAVLRQGQRAVILQVSGSHSPRTSSLSTPWEAGRSTDS